MERLGRPSQYGDSFADVYDQWYGSVTDADATAQFVADRCHSPNSTVLELGLGTGRLAIPMANLGLAVTGLDASLAMLDRCPVHPKITKVCGDMAAIPLTSEFDAVLIGFNTIFNLTTAESQQSLFGQLRPLVKPQGVLVIETFNPSLVTQESGATTDLNRRTAESITVVATSTNVETQQISGCHVTVANEGVHLRPWSLRWSRLDELDQWANQHGFGIEERSNGWDGTPADEYSENIVSVYRPKSR